MTLQEYKDKIDQYVAWSREAYKLRLPEKDDKLLTCDRFIFGGFVEYAQRHSKYR